MVSLEQVKLLEIKITKTIEYVKKVTEENTILKAKLNSCQQRIDELEVLVKQFKEEQSRIEDSILSALDRLNQFEDALESRFTKEEIPDSSKDKSGDYKADPGQPSSFPLNGDLDGEIDAPVLPAYSEQSESRESPSQQKQHINDSELDIF